MRYSFLLVTRWNLALHFAQFSKTDNCVIVSYRVASGVRRRFG